MGIVLGRDDLETMDGIMFDSINESSIFRLRGPFGQCMGQQQASNFFILVRTHNFKCILQIVGKEKEHDEWRTNGMHKRVARTL